nr:M28 family peptidase [Ardenticatena sp.]
MRLISLLLFILSLATACQAPSSSLPKNEFNGENALALANQQCTFGPRPTGSPALERTRSWLEEQLNATGWNATEQRGTFRGMEIVNIVATRGTGRPILIGAHYDTRPMADQDPTNPNGWILGGNDGASGTAALLELARTLDIPENLQVQLAFFDAEDRGNIDGWPFSVGAEQFAANPPTPRPEAVVILDMIGDRNLQIYRERNSDPKLTDVLFDIANELGYLNNGFYNEPRWTIIDDHLPFIRRGIPAVDLIDFDYPVWHTMEDTCEQLSAESLHKVGRVVETWIERGAPITPAP